MNFMPQPDPRKQIMADLEAGIAHYLATGKRIQDVKPGVSGEHHGFTAKKKARTTNASNQ